MPRPPERIDLPEGTYLRLLEPEDAVVVFEAVDRDRPRLRPWLPWVDRNLQPADTRAFIEATRAAEHEHGFGIWASDGFAGCIGLHMDPDHRSAMLGYWIAETHEGRGLVTEASRALTDLAFRDLAMHRVWLGADPANRRSCAVAERLGFRHEGVHREAEFVDGRYRDTAIYAILEDEWPPAQPDPA